LVSRYDVFAKFFAVDMATHGDGVVSPFKARQADAVTAHLTPEHHPPIVAQLRGLADTIRRMPNQLFVQAFLVIELVLKVIEESTLYYVQRLPAELGSIEWIIDQKNRTITEMEESPLQPMPPAYSLVWRPSRTSFNGNRTPGLVARVVLLSIRLPLCTRSPRPLLEEPPRGHRSSRSARLRCRQIYV